MGTPEFGHRAERRRKRVTRFVAGALVATVLIVAVAYRWKGASADKRPAIPQALPSNVNQQLSGYSFTRSDNGRRVFTVHAARSVAFKQGGTTVLKDVRVEVFGRSGNRHDLLRTGECTYNRQSGELFAEGKVEIELNAPSNELPEWNLMPQEVGSRLEAPKTRVARRGRVPIYLETSHLSFVRQGALVISDAPVKFRAGLASGTAEGLAYATRDDWLELQKNVVMEMRPKAGKELSSPLRLEASRVRYDKATGSVTLWGPVEITEQDRRVSAESGRIFLNAQNRVTAAELEGNVKAFVPSQAGVFQGSAQRVRAEFEPEAGQLRAMRAEGGVQAESRSGAKIIRLAAQQIQMNFSGASPRSQDGNATGNVQLTVERVPEAGAEPGRQGNSAGDLAGMKQDLTAGALRFAFAPGGRILKQAATVGAGKLVLVPADPRVGKRVITAEPFVMAFDARGRLAALHGLSQAHIVFMPPPTAPPGSPIAESSSDRLEATFEPSSQTLRTVEQTGDFRFQQGDQQAFAARARYDAPSEIFTLTGHPRVRDEETRAQADRIVVDLRTGTAEGLGHVQATHMEIADRAPGAPRSDPTNVVGDRMLAERPSQFVHYEGHVRVWHGMDVAESSSIDVYKTQRRVRSGSRVLTSFLQPAAEAPGAAINSSPARTETLPVTIRADGLEYFDEGRKASYRGNVQLETQNTTLGADRLDVYFSSTGAPEASEVERAVAEGHVTVVQPARRATGEHAEYFAAPGKILLTGGPPALYDAERGFTTGQRLTFFLRDDRIFLDGGEESPTLTEHRIPQ